MRIEQIEPNQVTFDHAVDFSSVFAIAFRNDPLMWAPQKPLYRFNDDIWDQVISIKDAQKRLSMIVARAQAFKDKVLQDAWAFYKVMIQPGTLTFLAYKEDLPIALSLWTAPPAVIKPEGLTTRILRYLKTLRANLNLWAFGLFHGYNPAMEPQADRILDQARDAVGLTNTPEREKSLENASEDEISVIPYTDKYTYELQYCACARQFQGIGTELFAETLKRVEARFQNVVIAGSERRPKIEIISSLPGLKVYSKFGFKLIDTYTTMITPSVEKEKIEFTTNFMVKSY